MSVFADRRSSLRTIFEKACAPFLILVTPFTVFLQFHGYSPADPGALFCLIGLAAIALVVGAVASFSRAAELITVAGLLTLWADLQFQPPKGIIGLAVIFIGLGAVLWIVREHAVRIVMATTGAIFLASIVLPVGSSAMRADRVAPAIQQGSGPLIVHLILDEQIGVEGLPAAISPRVFTEGLKAFFIDRGFLLFARAYSEYFNTYRSISELLNFKSGEFVKTLVGPGRTGMPWDLNENAYFAHLTGQGYAIHVYQPDYLNFCANPGPATSCHTYAATSLAALAPLSLPGRQKAMVIASMYLDRSSAYAFTRYLYGSARSELDRRGVHLPPWNWERNRLSPISTMTVMNRLAQDLSGARRGTAVFAHLLLPHYPYVYDRECRVRPPGEWLERMDHTDAPPGSINSASGRALRYARYEEQVECVEHQLDRLIQTIPPALARDAIIVIQGDHGSRIVRHEPSGGARLSADDYTDSYSTLFAVRSPWLAAGYDRRMTSIGCLMRTLGESDFRSLSRLDECRSTPSVYVVERKGKLALRPLPAFGEESESVIADRTPH